MVKVWKRSEYVYKRDTKLHCEKGIWRDVGQYNTIVRIPEMDLYRKWICIFCVIRMSGAMLGSMPEVVQQAEIPFLTQERRHEQMQVY